MKTRPSLLRPAGLPFLPSRAPALLRSGLAAALAAWASAARAHPGHAWSDSSPAHLLTDPEHAAALFAAGVGLALLARLARAVWLRRVAATAGAVAFGASLVAIGLRGAI